MGTFFLQDVPLADIRHNDLRSYCAEGFGGKPIDDWPVYRFFTMYREGNREEAVREFEDWYMDQLEKYAMVPKRDGGMCRGSLYSLIEKKCGVPFEKAEVSCRKTAIRERVLQRFGLLDTIQSHGYRAGEAERIDAFREKGLVYLTGGHHRAAILKALGEEKLPGVLVFPSRLVYNFFNLLRNIRYGDI